MAKTLFPKARREILGLMFGHPDEPFHLREIMRRIPMGQGAVQRELKALEQAGILEKRKDGNRVLYGVNPHSPIYAELRGLVLKTSGLIEVLQQALQAARPKIRLAAVYGSFAKGMDGPASDIDVLVVGSVSFKDVVKAVKPAEEVLGRSINATVYAEEEAIGLLKKKHHFLCSVLKEKMLFVFGSRHELARLAH